MSPVTDAAHYAESALQLTTTIVENVRLARDTYRVRFACEPLARRITPGQFIMLRLAGDDDPLLGRPLALYDVVRSPSGSPEGLDVVYLVQGKMTTRLTAFQPGQKLEVWGPLGNGFSARSAEHLIMVAGGIGQTPFLALAQECLGLARYGESGRQPCRAKRVTLCYGARSADYLAGVADFERLGVDVRVSTDDGSAGRHGLVTSLVEEALAESPQAHVISCGPEPMMEAVAHLASRRGVSCEVSLESPMACGVGICFSCVAKIRQPDGDWDYRRTCVEGPVFDAASIEW